MAKDLKNKVVVVTGAAGGLGLEIADKYLAKGAKIVVLLDTNETQGTEAAKTLTLKHGNRVAFIKCDVTKDLDDVFNKIIESFETVDVLVNNAGVADEASARRTIEINLIAVIEWTMKFWNHMNVEDGGRGGTIINISSILALSVVPSAPFYSTSKLAVLGFTRSIGHATHYAKSGVRVVAICPGFTYTNLGKNCSDWCWKNEFIAFIGTKTFQKTEAVGDAAVEVFEKAESGTAWLIEGARPIEEV